MSKNSQNAANPTLEHRFRGLAVVFQMGAAQYSNPGMVSSLGGKSCGK
jgi:hypothetical protein